MNYVVGYSHLVLEVVEPLEIEKFKVQVIYLTFSTIKTISSLFLNFE